jgi:hypothetical protein
MTGKTIPVTLATVVAALAFAVPAGAQGSMIPECLETPALCQPVGSKPAGKPRSQDLRPKAQPKVSADGTWRAGNHVMQ